MPASRNTHISLNDTDWTPQWTGKKPAKNKRALLTPHDYQEQHSPTVPQRIKTGPDSNITKVRRRALDSRIWNSLNIPQQEAALKIQYGYEHMSKGRGFKISAPHIERNGGRAPYRENLSQTAAIEFYMRWAKSCIKNGLSHAACLDIIVFGKTCSAVDKDRQTRKGAAKQNLIACLNVYCQLKGWPHA